MHVDVKHEQFTTAPDHRQDTVRVHHPENATARMGKTKSSMLAVPTAPNLGPMDEPTVYAVMKDHEIQDEVWEEAHIVAKVAAVASERQASYSSLKSDIDVKYAASESSVDAPSYIADERWHRLSEAAEEGQSFVEDPGRVTFQNPFFLLANLIAERTRSPSPAILPPSIHRGADKYQEDDEQTMAAAPGTPLEL